MIGSLYKDLSQIPIDEDSDSALTGDLTHRVDSSDDHLLTALPVVQRIVRRKTVFSWKSEAADLVQAVTLRLLRWRDNHREKSEKMSQSDWQSFAAKTAYNEINRHFADNSLKDVSIDSVSVAATNDLVEGQTDAEVCSLVMEVWQKICSLSLRQRQALLLSSQELIIYFLQCGITDEELANSLNLTIEEWAKVKDRLHLKDKQIAELLKKAGNQNKNESLIRSMKKARHEARLKVRRVTENE